MKREFLKITKGLADLSKHIDDRLADTASQLKAELKAELKTELKAALGAEIKAEFAEFRTEVRSELRSELKPIKSGLQKLTTRFDDFLAQDDVARLERRTTTERLDNLERRLQRLEARPA